MAAGANQQSGPKVPVHDPAAVSSLQRCHRFTLYEAHAAALQKEVVELAPPYAVTYGLSIAGNLIRSANQAGAEAGYFLKNPVPTVFLAVNIQGFQCRRSYPACTRFLSGKRLFVDQQHIKTSLPQFTGTGGTGRPAADN
jgi:hypothetical protein